MLSPEKIKQIESDALMFGRTNKDVVYGYESGATAEAEKAAKQQEAAQGKEVDTYNWLIEKSKKKPVGERYSFDEVVGIINLFKSQL